MKDNQKVVGATGIEPVTPTMSTKHLHQSAPESCIRSPQNDADRGDSAPIIATVSGEYPGTGAIIAVAVLIAALMLLLAFGGRLTEEPKTNPAKIEGRS